MYQILALNNPYGVNMPLKRPNLSKINPVLKIKPALLSHVCLNV